MWNHPAKSGYILGLAIDSELLLNYPYSTSTVDEVRKHLIQFKGVGLGRQKW